MIVRARFNLDNESRGFRLVSADKRLPKSQESSLEFRRRYTVVFFRCGLRIFARFARTAHLFKRQLPWPMDSVRGRRALGTLPRKFQRQFNDGNGDSRSHGPDEDGGKCHMHRIFEQAGGFESTSNSLHNWDRKLFCRKLTECFACTLTPPPGTDLDQFRSPGARSQRITARCVRRTVSPAAVCTREASCDAGGDFKNARHNSATEAQDVVFDQNTSNGNLALLIFHHYLRCRIRRGDPDVPITYCTNFAECESPEVISAESY